MRLAYNATSPRDSKPSPWITFWKSVIRFQPEKISPWLALRNALGIALPLAVGAAVGAIPSGVVMSTGALNVAFSDNFDPYSRRGRRMFVASVIVAVAVFPRNLHRNYPPTARGSRPRVAVWGRLFVRTQHH